MAQKFLNITTATTTVVKGSRGKLVRIIFNKHVATGITTVYDNTAASGTKIGTITVGAAVLSDPPVAAEYGLEGIIFSIGLTIVTSAAEDITVVYS